MKTFAAMWGRHRFGSLFPQAGRVVDLTAFDRLSVIADQGLVSVANLVLTLTLARFYDPTYLAGYAIGSTLALVLQGVYRATFVLPAALLDLHTFRFRAARLVAQHVVVVTGVTALTAVAAGLEAWFHATPLGTASAVATVTCVLLFLSIDFDRALTLRLGYRALPLGFAIGYLVLLGGLVLGVLRYHVSFGGLMAALGCFGAARMVSCSVLLQKPDFHRTGRLLRINARHNLQWGAVSNLAAIGYASAPLLLLGWSAPALNVAAYNAMRNLTQPLQLLLRSFDMFDKLAFSALDRSDPAAQRTHVLSVLSSYVALSLAFMLVVLLGRQPIISLAFGSRYDGFGGTLIAWSVLTAVTCWLGPLETIVYRTRRLKSYALLQVAGSVCAAATAWPLIHACGDVGAASASLLGTVVVFVGLVVLCRPLLGLRGTTARPG